MYLFGLSPTLTPLVSTANLADLDAAIERARLVEAGFNYAPTPTLGSSQTEVDELTKKIEQLSLNYANLASVLTVQVAPNNSNNNTQRQNQQNQSYRPRRQNNNRNCFTCNQPGHIARNCPNRPTTPTQNNQSYNRQPRRTRFNVPVNNRRSFNYVDSYYENEESDCYEDEIEAETYVVSRSGKQYTRPSSRRSESIQEERLRKPTIPE